MKTCAIFLILLSVISFAYTQKAFVEVKNVLSKFKQSNIDEQKAADVREKNERAWCQNAIAVAQKDLADREKAAAKLKKQIKDTETEIKEWELDVQRRRKRIKDNNELLKKFKKQRCDNNIIFVKNLRDHMEGIDILGLLRQDIVVYFNKKLPAIVKPAQNPMAKTKFVAKKLSDTPKPTKKATNTGFVEVSSLELKLIQKIEKLEDFANLLDDDHKLILNQLTKFGDDVKKHTKNVDEFTKVKERSVKQIGTGHVDNNRGELKKLEAPGYTGVLKFNAETKKKILDMIDSLIAHLRASKNRLIEDEIRAAVDFAHFQRKLLRENKHLERTIQRLLLKIKNAKLLLIKLRAALKKALELVKKAKAKLASLQKLCQRKYDYFIRETKRRNGENKTIDTAIAIFVKLMNRSAKYRARSRASSGFYGKAYAKADQTKERVVVAAPVVHNDLAGRQKTRNEVAF